MKTVVAFFFLFIFTFQIVPVRAIGKLIVKGQQTEEVKEDCSDTDSEDGKDTKDSVCGDFICSNSPSLFPAPVLMPAAKMQVQTHEHLPNTYIMDIHCPPPNPATV